MRLFGKDLDREVPVVAEIGVNHEGDPAKALELIGLAADAGADAVKFQTYTPERFASAAEPARLERVTRFSLDPGVWGELAAEAASKGIGFFSTPVTEDVVPLLDRHCSVFKVASGDITFEPVIRATVASGKPVIVSTGAATVEEVAQALAWCRDEAGSDDLTGRIVLMHCVSAYPTPIEHANLRAIPFLAETFGLRTGYSNHVVEQEAALAAVALGAQIVEVHFTDCKTGRSFRDHELSADPADLERLVTSVRKVRASLGEFGKPLAPAELEIRQIIRKGVVAARDLEPGTVLAIDDLMFARPATEVPSTALSEVLGRTLQVAVARGIPLRFGMLEAP
jgi:N,N'-diacetyllegionaminate synthase